MTATLKSLSAVGANLDLRGQCEAIAPADHLDGTPAEELSKDQRNVLLARKLSAVDSALKLAKVFARSVDETRGEDGENGSTSQRMAELLAPVLAWRQSPSSTGELSVQEGLFRLGLVQIQVVGIGGVQKEVQQRNTQGPVEKIAFAVAQAVLAPKASDAAAQLVAVAYTVASQLEVLDGKPSGHFHDVIKGVVASAGL